MTIDVTIYKQAFMKDNKKLAVGDLIEASHGSRIDVREQGDKLIPYSKCNPTGIFGVAVGRLKCPVELENGFKSNHGYPIPLPIIARPGTMIIGNIVHTYGIEYFAPLYMYTNIDMNNDSNGLAIVAGCLTGFTTKEKPVDYHSTLSKLLPGFIEFEYEIEASGYGQSTRVGQIYLPTVKQKIIEHIVQRDKKRYVFKSPDGNSYPLEQILLSLEEQKD